MKGLALVSIYESGMQPLLLSTAATALLQKGIEPDVYDLYLDKKKEWEICQHRMVAISLALFDSLEGGVKLARRIRNVSPSTYVCFYGPYAHLNRERLERYADSVIDGDWEEVIPELAAAVLAGETMDMVPGNSEKYRFCSDSYRVPARHLLPSIKRYKNVLIEKVVKKSLVTGNVETSRGCHYSCQFCSVYAIFKRKFSLVPVEIIMQDIDQLVRDGAEHITFVDAEFLNKIDNSLEIAERLHEKYPHLTYDFTTRVDTIVNNEEVIHKFGVTGCIAVTTSIEFPSQKVLDELKKNISLHQIAEAIKILKRYGIKPNATFMTFNPWVDIDDLVNLCDFVEENNLNEVIDPIQFETKLHLFKGSPILENEVVAHSRLEEKEFHWEWEHQDERVERIYQKMVQPPQPGELKRCCIRC